MSCGVINRRSARLAIAWVFAFAVGLGFSFGETRAAELVLEPKMRHLRNAEPREWTEFPEQAEAKELTYSFEVTDTFRPQTFVLRHRDLRRDWLITLDGQPLIRLAQGDQDATTFWPLDAARFKPGKHELTISCKDKAADDVMIGELRLDTRSKVEMLGEATIEVEVAGDTSESHSVGLIPCRLTLVDERGSLMTMGIAPDPRLSIRPGVIYTLDGRAKFTVPAGKYVLYASRGFEYSVAETKLDLKPGDVATPRLVIKKEFYLKDWIACDTHVHTLTHSGHGDCTIEERFVTLAGEGIELAITTDHNKTIDYRTAMSEKLKPMYDKWFTSIVGNEVTTDFGHFNVFPLDPRGPLIDHQGKDWAQIGAAIDKSDGKPIVILNHARDIHKGFRPFDPKRHIAVAGEDVEGWKLPANAMEVINSGSTQSDPWQLFHDWMGLLNRGMNVTPIGSSDSHDVTRYIVGQGRTYIPARRSAAGVVNPAEVIGNLSEGRVMAGMGIVCNVIVDEEMLKKFLASTPRSIAFSVDVYKPRWISLDEIRLFANGIEFSRGGTKPQFQDDGARRITDWLEEGFKHDVHVVALVKGSGVDKPYWPIAKPYQPTSPDWKSYVIGCSAAIKIDADGDGKYSSPYDYAKKLFAESGTDDAKLIAALKDYDEAVAVQAASVARAAGRERFDAFLAEVAKSGAEQTKTGARKYVEGWRATLVGAKDSATSQEKK